MVSKEGEMSYRKNSTFSYVSFFFSWHIFRWVESKYIQTHCSMPILKQTSFIFRKQLFMQHNQGDDVFFLELSWQTSAIHLGMRKLIRKEETKETESWVFVDFFYYYFLFFYKWRSWKTVLTLSLSTLSFYIHFQVTKFLQGWPYKRLIWSETYWLEAMGVLTINNRQTQRPSCHLRKFSFMILLLMLYRCKILRCQV